MSAEIVRNVGLLLLAAMAVSLILSMLLFLLVVSKLRKIEVPADAGFSETLLYTPLLLVVFIDLLDFALDILAAPFAWLVLDRLGLRALRGVAAFEAFLPFTQLIPTMTLAWLAVRIMGPKLVLASE